MGLRCSLLGHDFGDPEVEREREERGSEVVLTVREIAECRRCSRTNVVSENKEVTALHGRDERDEDGSDADLTVDADATPEPSTGEASDADENEVDEEDQEDDAVIIEDDEDEENDDRAHGEWPEPAEPDEEDDADDAPAEWPTLDSDDEGFDARPSTGGDAAVEFGGGLAPERATVEEEEGLEYVESAQPDPPGSDSSGESAADDGFTRAGAAPSPAEPATADVDAEFVCPQCGFVDDVIGSSLRAGDVCPDCRKGYLGER
jgi:hypothetical protein